MRTRDGEIAGGDRIVLDLDPHEPMRAVHVIFQYDIGIVLLPERRSDLRALEFGHAVQVPVAAGSGDDISVFLIVDLAGKALIIVNMGGKNNIWIRAARRDRASKRSFIAGLPP